MTLALRLWHLLTDKCTKLEPIPGHTLGTIAYMKRCVECGRVFDFYRDR